MWVALFLPPALQNLQILHRDFAYLHRVIRAFMGSCRAYLPEYLQEREYFQHKL